MNMVTNKKEFKELVLNSPGIQVVKFYAEWSGTCQMMVPIYNELALSYNNQASFFAVDVEVASLLKKELGVNDLPTILFYKNGAIIDFVNGMISKNALFEKMENILIQNINHLSN